MAQDQVRCIWLKRSLLINSNHSNIQHFQLPKICALKMESLWLQKKEIHESIAEMNAKSLPKPSCGRPFCPGLFPKLSSSSSEKEKSRNILTRERYMMYKLGHVHHGKQHVHESLHKFIHEPPVLTVFIITC